MDTARRLLTEAITRDAAIIEGELHYLGNINSCDRTPEQEARLSEVFAICCFQIGMESSIGTNVVDVFDIKPLFISFDGEAPLYIPPSREQKRALAKEFPDTYPGEL